MILTFEFNFFMRYASFSTFTIATFLSVFVGYFMALSAMCKILHPLLLFFVPHFNLLHLSSISFSYPLFFSFPFSLSSFLTLSSFPSHFPLLSLPSSSFYLSLPPFPVPSSSLPLSFFSFSLLPSHLHPSFIDYFLLGFSFLWM